MKIVKIFLMAIVLAGMVGGLTSWQYAEQPYNEAEYALEALNDASERNVKAGKTRRTETSQDDLSKTLPDAIKRRVERAGAVPASELRKLQGKQKEVMKAYYAWLKSDYSRMDDEQQAETKTQLENVKTFKGLQNVITIFKHKNR